MTAVLKNLSLRSRLRCFFIVWYILFFHCIIRAQPSDDFRDLAEDLDFNWTNLSLYGENVLFYKTGDNAYTFGARLDLSLGRVGFYYKLGVGGNPYGRPYVHLPLGAQVGAYIAVYALQSHFYLLFPALLCTVVPEGVNFRIWEKNKTTFKLYLSPWSSELNLSKEHFTLISGECGLQTTFFNHRKYNVSCYGGTKVLYKNFQPALVIGATVGILLD